MKKLSDFANNIISEQRGRPRKNPQVQDDEFKGKKVDTFDGDKKTKEPVDDEAIDDIDLNSEENTESMEDLIDKFDAEEDFFIIGKAGWGKTSIIQKLAKKYNREVKVVYLDKAAKEDLGGIPIPVKGKDGAEQEMAMPAWAVEMKKNPKTNYLLFFDEMNQADPGIMNALMPIVLEHKICDIKFKNFFVGAAGNFESENDAVSELSGPLKSRFKPLIVWETGTAKSWKSSFNHLHKKWDNELGKSFVKAIEENVELFDNPREIDHKILQFYFNIKKGEGLSRLNTNKIYRRLQGLAKEDLSRHQDAQMKQLAETIYNELKSNPSNNKGKGGGRSAKKDINMVNPDIIAAIKEGMKKGYYLDRASGTKYGVSRENINVIIDEEEVNAEMLERIINKLEADGIEFKYEKNKQWKDAGYVDPDED